MNYACPHCHELLVTDTVSGLPPAMCPRCGGDVDTRANDLAPAVAPTAARATPPAARSIATFLRGNRTEAEVAAPDDAGGHIAVDDAMPEAQAEPEQQPPLDQPVSGIEDLPGDEWEPPTDESRQHPAPLVAMDAASAEARVPAVVAEGGEGALRPATSTDEDASNDADRASIEAPPEAARTPVSSSALLPEDASAPSFTLSSRGPTIAPGIRIWQWAALVLLALGLVLQLLLADRARLAAYAQWRPVLVSLCGVFGCSLPNWNAPEAFTMLSRDVRPMPGAPGTLLVQATFRNDARWSQGWPVLQLSLADADGRVVGARAFTPAEYLEPGTTQTRLDPGQSAQVVLQVREPQASVVAFSFEFH